MDVLEYESAYYQIQDEVIDSLPLERNDEAYLD